MSSALKHPCDEAFIRSTRAEAPCARKVVPWVLAATILESSMAFIDETAVSGYRVVMLVATAVVLRSSPTTRRREYWLPE